MLAKSKIYSRVPFVYEGLIISWGIKGRRFIVVSYPLVPEIDSLTATVSVESPSGHVLFFLA